MTQFQLGVDVGQQSDPTVLCVTEVGERPKSPLGPDLARVLGFADEAEMTRAMLADHNFTASPKYRDVRDYLIALDADAEEMEATYTMRRIGALPLGTPYPLVAKTIVETVLRLRARGQMIKPRIYLDDTGVGKAVTDMVYQPLKGRATLYPVTFVQGDKYDRKKPAKRLKGQAMPGDTTETAVQPRLRRPNERVLGKAYMVGRLQALIQTRPPRLSMPDNADTRILREQLRKFVVKPSVTADAFEAQDGYHDDYVIAAALSVMDEPRRLQPNMGTEEDFVGMIGTTTDWRDWRF